MAKRSKNEMKIFNRGRRVYETKFGGLPPERTITVPEDYGRKMMKAYPKDIIDSGTIPNTKDAKKRLAELEAREKVVAEKEAALKEIEAGIKPLASEKQKEADK